MRKPWQYVREAWQKTEVLASDRDCLGVWIDVVQRAMADAYDAGVEDASGDSDDSIWDERINLQQGGSGAEG